MKAHATSKRNIAHGLVSGVIGGLVLALMMVKMRMLGSVGTIIGMPNPLSGLLFHFILDAILGIVFAMVFFRWMHTFFSCAILGIVFGILWWIVGILLLAPLFLGHFLPWSCGALPMLMAELVFGLVLGITYYFLKKSKH